jgi:hypothetical protein
VLDYVEKAQLLGEREALPLPALSAFEMG